MIGRTLKRRVAVVFIVVTLVSILLIGVLNFFAARELLDSGAQDRLSSIGKSRARSIERNIGRFRARISVVAADLAVATALDDLGAAYEQLPDLAPDQDADLEDWYRGEIVAPIEEVGLGPVQLEELMPQTAPGRYLQYHYLANPQPDAATGPDIVDPGDGSSYSAAHVRHHPYLADLAGGLGGADLLLITAGGDVVYSGEKKIDLGTNLATGPYRNSTLAHALREKLSQRATGESVIADLQLYLPAQGTPTLFMVAAVRRDTAVIGAVAVEVASSTLNDFTTAGQNWEAVGLGEGESYVVGADLVLRSESRLWLEDPDAYLELADDDELERLIGIAGSPVGLQLVDTEPVRSALDGESFEGQSTNYLGQATFSSAVPIDVEGVDWIVVVDTPLDEARSGLTDYLTRLGLVLLVLLPVAGLIGLFLADQLSRPLPPVLEAAKDVADGERDPEFETVAGDELGDLVRRLRRTAIELGRQEKALEAEFDQKRSLLMSVLPARLVSRDGSIGTDTTEAIETTTVVAIGFEVRATDGSTTGERSTVELLASVAEQVDTLAADHEIERVRLAADRHLFLAGVGHGDYGADDALAFAAEAASVAHHVVESEHMAVAVHIGLATGPVATGLLDQGSLTFGAWGEPVRQALAIAALSSADEVLVHATTIEATTGSDFDFEPATDVISLDGSPMQLQTLQVRQPDRSVS